MKTEPTIRVAVVDDHALVVDGIAAGLSAIPDIELVSTAGTFKDAQPVVTANDVGTEFRVDGKAFAHPWLERLDPKKGRVPNLDVAVIRIPSETDKDVLISMYPAVFFTEPHFDGYASVQVRLAAVSEPVLEQLLVDAWRTRAPKRLLTAERRGA